MARPKRKGLDFYYKSVHELDDFRVMDLMEKYGAVGYVVLDMTMSCVYRNGYYLEMPINRLASYIYRYIAGTCTQNSHDIAEMINYCGELGLFDKELLGQSVITSREIQEHYSSVAARRKADKSKYWLLPPSNDSPSRENEETQKGHSAAETPVLTAETPVFAAKTRINDAETQINAAIIPQSKENKSKANKSKQNQSKQNQSKANQSKANQSKAKQNTRMSADEIFCEPDADEAFACDDADTGENGYDADADEAFACDDDADTGENGYDADADEAFACGDDADMGYDDIENAYYTAAGRMLNDTDKADIDVIRGEGADDSLIIYAIRKVASRRNRQKINSFRYFMSIIRELMQETKQNIHQTYHSNHHAKPASPPMHYPQYNDGFIHNETVYEDPYAACTTNEEYLAVLDREFNSAPRW